MLWIKTSFGIEWGLLFDIVSNFIPATSDVKRVFFFTYIGVYTFCCKKQLGVNDLLKLFLSYHSLCYKCIVFERTYAKCLQ